MLKPKLLMLLLLPWHSPLPLQTIVNKLNIASVTRYLTSNKLFFWSGFSVDLCYLMITSNSNRVI